MVLGGLKNLLRCFILLLRSLFSHLYWSPESLALQKRDLGVVCVHQSHEKLESIVFLLHFQKLTVSSGLHTQLSNLLSLVGTLEKQLTGT